MASSLPLETLNSIFDHLLYDKHTLAACATVHTTWTALARQHLFRDITIDFGSDNVDQLSYVFPVSGRGMVNFVRRLELLDKLVPMGCKRPTDAFPVTLLPQFPSLTSLSFRCSYIEQLSISDRSWIKTQVQTLESLEIHPSPGSMDDVLSIISSASFIKSLSVLGVFSIKTPATLTSQQIIDVFTRNVPPPINHLSVSFFSVRDNDTRETAMRLVKWIAFHPSHNSIRRFVASDMNEKALPSINYCLQKFGANLEELSLIPAGKVDLAMLAPYIKLDGTDKLLSISLRPKFRSEFDQDVQGLREMISKIPSGHLNRVTFEIDPIFTDFAAKGYFKENIQDQQFELTDAYFSQENSKHPAQSAVLRLLFYTDRRFFTDTGVTIDELGELMKLAFPLMHALDRLRVEFIDGSGMHWDYF